MKRNLIEMWRFRALTLALVGRHLNARYRGSLLGFLWSFINPLLLIGTYTLVFKFYIRFSEVENYTLFLFTGLLPWIWFSSGLIEATASISSGGSLVTKAMFPTHILPCVAVFTNFANFLFAVPLLVLMMALVGLYPGWSLLVLPLLLLIQLVFMLGLGLGLSALNVRFRDVQHIVGNLLTLWFFLCPILYPAHIIPERFRFTLWLNPPALLTQMYQSVLYERVFPDMLPLAASALCAVMAFVVGNFIFNRGRDEFAELV